MLEALHVHRLDVVANRPVIVGGPLDFSLAAGDLVLLVGVGVDEAYAGDVVRRAARAGAAAVVVRGPEDAAEPLRRGAEEAGITLLRVPPGVTWDQLYVFLDAALSGQEAAEALPVSDMPSGDLFALANAVASVIRGPVTIEDANSRVLAFSNDTEHFDEPRRQSILGRRTPESWMRRFRDAGVFQRFWAGDRVVHIDHFVDEGLRPRLVVAIRAGGEVLGAIWAAEGERPLGPEAEDVLSEASRIAAVHLLRQRATSELERHARAELLRSLFAGVGDTHAIAGRLGLDATAPVTVVAFRPVEHGDATRAAERTLPLVRLACEAYHRRSSCISEGATIYVLLPARHEDDVAPLVADIVDRAQAALGVSLHGAIGSVGAGLGDVHRCRLDAEEVLGVVGRVPGRRVASVHDVSTELVLERLAKLVRDWAPPHASELEALADYDLIHQTGYSNTLIAWLDAFGDVAVAAKRLGIHPNTLRYRLRRLSELAGIDLADPDERLVLDLELRLWPPRGLPTAPVEDVLEGPAASRQ